MGICNNKKFLYISLKLILILSFFNPSFADIDFKKLEDKKVSYLDFFLLKFENKLISSSQILRAQMIALRVQYSGIGVSVKFDEKEKNIFTEIYAVMDKNRYSKKKYKQKLSDCNQVRNLLFYKKYGYRVFTQKRDPSLSEDIMKNIFIETFFDNLSFSKKEIEFLLKNMFVRVTIFHPINKTELICSGKINDYELR
tara:strand:- start:52 stop:642 length:591 start_codon:yes stop_codon:yes gene_type:complete